MNELSLDNSVRLDLYYRLKDTFRKTINVENANKSLFDFTGYSATLEIYSGPSDNTPNTVFGIGNGLELGLGFIRLTKSARAMKVNRREYIYILRFTHPDSTLRTWLNGKFRVNDGIFDGIPSTDTLTIDPDGASLTLVLNVGDGSGSGGTVELPTFTNGTIYDQAQKTVEQGGELTKNTAVGGGNSFGMAWGRVDSVMSFFNVIGEGWRMLMNATTGFLFETDKNVQYNGGSTSKFSINGFKGVVIGNDEIQDSAILQLASNSKAFLFNIVSNLAGIATPQPGMVVGSASDSDLMLYFNNVWTGVTRPKIVVTAATNIDISEADRNSIYILTGNGPKVINYGLGLSSGHSTFIFKKQSATGNITLTGVGGANIDAFNNTIYVGGASVVHAGGGQFYASGSLGPFVNASDITAAIADALAAANAYSEDLVQAIEFLTQRTIAGTGTLTLDAVSALSKFTSATANTITIPPNSSIPYTLGTQALFVQYGAGQVTFAPGAGVTIRSSGTKLKTQAQYAVCSLIKIDTNEWLLSGDLVA